MRVLAVIPARYGSSRFEGKPLAEIEGLPMIAWVYRRVRRSRRLADVVVATDDERIARACERHQLNHIMTSASHATSTERLNEVASRLPADLYLCVNGDEPLIEHQLFEQIIPDHLPDAPIYVANLACRIKTAAEVVDPTNIKVVWAPDGRALFFSRSPIPFPKGSLDFEYHKHVGVLIYNRAALEFFAQTPRGPVERAEDVNELRFVENGVPLSMIVVEPGQGLSVDTPKDLERVREVVRQRRLSPD